ncbi:amphi-Trp domain-containing protein [Patescibacteria group bacterium]|nr:amphi-Trp domain-containing protein [Patescibacteria group bacterium]MBU1663085.1 amphi-Trp domain-containing protein [Patescibacteria group bacterium]MBU1934062.1 amphi-Trp domain-containing protein [Patescibacteria group bacterium]MBU2233970.1 amphi-Trp domain-containing protein [Patescibacteria group bacterium]MBU2263779.1 amphi-Trp domain-containing protein [Patescibacteria group bacterium]
MKRDIEKNYTKKQFVEKLRRLVDSIENDRRFSIQIAGKKIVVPKNAVINIEHEKEGKTEEVEFQLKWINE